MAQNIKTPEFRLSFPTLFEARKQSDDPNAKAKFSISMLFPKGEKLKELKKAAKACAKEKYGDNMPKKFKWPFLNQGDYEYEGYEDGALMVRASSINRPGIVDRKVQAITDPSEVYAGMYAIATLRPFVYDVNGNRGVSFGLQNIQILRDGEPLDGRMRPEQEFEAVEQDDVFDDEDDDDDDPDDDLPI